MKYLAPFLLLFSFSVLVHAQNNTEVYLFDIEEDLSLSNPVNISNNTGYDNQPSITPDGKTVLFASTRNDQTDILWYDIDSGSKTWLSDTPGGEYSPILMPDGKHISAVRLDPDGLQRLYKYPIKKEASEVIIPDLVVGYYLWYNPTQLIAFVLGDPQTLQEIDVASNTIEIPYENPGRSIHKIPDTQKYSFIDKSSSDSWIIMQTIPGSKNSTKEITPTLPLSEDMVWLNETTILMGKDSRLFYFDIEAKSKKWQLFADLSKYSLTGISRLAVGNNKLAVVVSGK
ncbi:MAG: PD40 domain-containing protein [Balneola sp.]